MAELPAGMVERASRAVNESAAMPGDPPWDKLPPWTQAICTRAAEAALTAALGDEYVVVPKGAVEAERERCAKIAVSFGDFPGDRFLKEIRMMCGNAIADKIREVPAASVG